ncbi:Alpha-galactosidase 3 [Diplonema papillatum]|nr:Alpha-galactosidase 3 [Diplonema papillatum]
MKTTVVLLALAGGAAGIDNGLGLTPPMGWRSWNTFGHAVSQDLMQGVMDAMVAKVLPVDGVPTSFLDLGYNNVGLDDNWQACGTGYKAGFHDQTGAPLINKTTFPDMSSMTAYGHGKGLRVGWYANNCICAENQYQDAAYIASHMEMSAKAVAANGYDGVKLDNCGQFKNLTWWAELLNATGRPIMIENCHWGGTVPGQTGGNAPCTGLTMPSDCPYNFFRSSSDIFNNWFDVMRNLQSTVAYSGNPPLSRPGTWAYPDMLEVGNMPTHEEDRTHFGAWCIVSAPLILGHNVTDAAINARIWDIVANKEAIAINQDWAGHPGTRIVGNTTGSVYQLWTKPLTGGAAAVFILNNSSDPMPVTFQFADFGFTSADNVTVRDVWSHFDAGTYQASYTTDSITTHDSRFYKLSKQQQ